MPWKLSVDDLGLLCWWIGAGHTNRSRLVLAVVSGIQVVLACRLPLASRNPGNHECVAPGQEEHTSTVFLSRASRSDNKPSNEIQTPPVFIIKASLYFSPPAQRHYPPTPHFPSSYPHFCMQPTMPQLPQPTPAPGPPCCPRGGISVSSRSPSAQSARRSGAPRTPSAGSARLNYGVGR
jgi:hypothetical protein